MRGGIKGDCDFFESKVYVDSKKIDGVREVARGRDCGKVVGDRLV